MPLSGEAVRCPDCGTELSSDAATAGLCPRCLLSLALVGSVVDAGPRPGVDSDEEAPTLQGPSPGRIVGERYQMRELLGRGGMGEVWRTFDLKLRMDVALKSVRQEHLGSEKARELLRQEVRSAREVVSPNVCRIFDLVVDEDRELVSMEYIDGTTLSETLRQRGPLPLQEAREIASQFLSGLEAIHQAGLVHRDFKPENVMLTRAGRVVVMDFGLAKGLGGPRTGTVSGTPAYMSPEQSRGEVLDGRADVFAAGVVLAEMLSVGGEGGMASRQALWGAVRETPPRVPEGPWAGVLRQALDPEPGKRPASARALAHALEEVTLRLPGFEDKRPYPGLLSFTEEEAEYFFGREAEVEGVWRKLKRPRLLALIGPSGTGKSSFIRAGLLPALPPGWAALVTTPGHRPFQSLAQALAPSLAGDAKAVQSLVRFEEADTAVELVGGWRRRHEHALVVVDQFEELFTLNPAETQAGFAELLGRLVLEADVHVLLSLRDDFLFQCHGHEALTPILNELTLLGPLSESALRRALVQPALACGYRFEDEGLVEEMIGEVGQERGALPLLAFAASRLWEKRERERGLLTREAYQEIGGVAGALAQHAEATLERIGSHRTPLVRELFRNLVTAQGTRAVREKRELLSVFGDGAGGGQKTEGVAVAASDSARAESAPRPSDRGLGSRAEAESVLAQLVDARLLTSFERAGDEEGESHQEVEIVHESLLSRWPRLVRWQTQDADGAQLRDQLRQAAQLWHDRGQTDDLLWSGRAYRDFALWRERYPGGLTPSEEDFADAMAASAGRRKRRIRLATAGVIGTLLAVVGVVTVLWQRSETARVRAEASRLLSLGQLEVQTDPSTAVAYALRSLELADTPETRLFALEALQRGPTTFVHDLGRLTGQARTTQVAFSPDGDWLASGDAEGHVLLWARDGGPPILLGSHGSSGLTGVAFGPRGERLVSFQDRARVWSVRDKRLVRTLAAVVSTPGASGSPPVSDSQVWVRGERVIVVTQVGGRELDLVRTWPLEGGEPQLVGRMPHTWKGCDVDARGTRLACPEGNDVRLRSLGDWDQPPRLVGRHEAPVEGAMFDPDGRVWATDRSGEIRLWPVAHGMEQPLRILQGRANPFASALSPDGSWLAVAVRPRGSKRSIQLWDLDAPAEADPLNLRLPFADWVAFDPNSRWLVTANGPALNLHPLVRRNPRVLRGHELSVRGLGVSLEGCFLASTSEDASTRIWPLDAGGRSRELATEARVRAVQTVNFDATGRNLLLPGAPTGALLAPVDGGRPRALAGAGRPMFATALSPDGSLVAGAPVFGPAATKLMHVWDLTSGEHRTLGPLPAAGDGYAGGVWDLEFSHDGGLFSIADGEGGIARWDVEQGRVEVLYRGSWEMLGEIAVTADGRRLYAATATGVGNDATMVGELHVLDLDSGAVRLLDTHGRRLQSVALGGRGKILATGDSKGILRVGPAGGEAPHILFGHDGAINAVAVDPRGRWVASAGEDATIRVWPMPEGVPFHTLPHAELLETLRRLTNLRVVPDSGSATGYKVEPGPFPGWAEVPEWW